MHLTRPAMLALALCCVAPAPAAAADAGTIRITLASPAKGRAKPAFAGARLTAGTPAKGSRTTLTLPVRTARLRATSTATLGGTLKLRAGRRAVTVRSLRLTVTRRTTRLSGRVGARRVTLLQSRTGTRLRTGATTLTLRRGALKLTSKGARELRSRLKRRAKSGTTLGVVSGTIGADAVTTPAAGPPATPAPRPGVVAPAAPAPAAAVVVPAPAPAPAPTPQPDPVTSPATTFTAACTGAPAPLPAAAPGTPAPEPAPALTATAAISGASTLTWGVRESWRWYLKALGGLTAAWDGATLDPDATTPSGPAYGVYTFPGAPTPGVYEQGATPAGDRAIVPFRGRVDFCHASHTFRITLSNPTVIIDGADSRIVADADANHDGVLMPNERLDVARLDLSGITPVRTTTTVTWVDVPATFLPGGSRAFSGNGNGGGGSYPAGSAMDPVTVVAALDTA